ncbi:anti-sigma-I factor RsgI family protein [Alkalibacillus salilacus]|uniref:Anti-sigma factor RsgI-like middle domain-containing protein n=1 Tax=Alkalibacillus salilacus TaxID=284582 RepID=A0ABT9VF97_9BACI|nr:hypothetical protein [Alkalibacillus salilacus]MDQ0159642.1 hypothetical protein [Alkalibacillus salilacus]
MKTVISGKVVKVTDEEIVLLTDDARLKNIKRLEHEFPLIGETYTTTISSGPTFTWLQYASVAAVLLISVIVYQLVMEQDKGSVYLVAMDINPSIEIELDEDFNVLDMTANNSDGEKIIEEISEDQLFSEVVRELNISLQELGYINEEENMTLVSTVILMNSDQELQTKVIEQEIQSEMTNGSDQLTIMSGSKDDYDEAKQLNMSVNEYIIGKELEVSGEVDRVQDAADQPIDQLMEKYKANQGQQSKQTHEMTKPNKKINEFKIQNDIQEQKNDTPQSPGQSNKTKTNLNSSGEHQKEKNKSEELDHQNQDSTQSEVNQKKKKNDSSSNQNRREEKEDNRNENGQSQEDAPNSNGERSKANENGEQDDKRELNESNERKDDSQNQSESANEDNNTNDKSTNEEKESNDTQESLAEENEKSNEANEQRHTDDNDEIQQPSSESDDTPFESSEVDENKKNNVSDESKGNKQSDKNN